MFILYQHNITKTQLEKKWIHCDQPIVKKINETDATRCHMLMQKNHKIRFLPGLYPRPRWISQTNVERLSKCRKVAKYSPETFRKFFTEQSVTKLSPESSIETSWIFFGQQSVTQFSPTTTVKTFSENFRRLTTFNEIFASPLCTTSTKARTAKCNWRLTIIKPRNGLRIIDT